MKGPCDTVRGWGQQRAKEGRGRSLVHKSPAGTGQKANLPSELYRVAVGSRREAGDAIGDLSAAGRPAGRGGGSRISCPGRGDKGSGDKNRSEGAHLGSKEKFKGSRDRGLVLLAGWKAEKNKVTEQAEREGRGVLPLSPPLLDVD